MTHKTALLFNTNFPEDGSRVTDVRQGEICLRNEKQDFT